MVSDAERMGLDQPVISAGMFNPETSACSNSRKDDVPSPGKTSRKGSRETNSRSKKGKEKHSSGENKTDQRRTENKVESRKGRSSRSQKQLLSGEQNTNETLKKDEFSGKIADWISAPVNIEQMEIVRNQEIVQKEEEIVQKEVRGRRRTAESEEGELMKLQKTMFCDLCYTEPQPHNHDPDTCPNIVCRLCRVQGHGAFTKQCPSVRP